MPTQSFNSVLVVEDDAALAGNLMSMLEGERFQVDVAYSGQMAFSLLQAQRFDAILLDVGLPGLDGWRVLSHIRNELRMNTPILMLTARVSIEDKTLGFTAGADDYLTKPYSLAEVLLRVKALLRRAHPTRVEHDVLTCGALSYSLRSRRVSVDGMELKLPKKSLQILEILIHKHGQVVTRSELENLLWPHDALSSDVLRSQMHILRRFLSRHGFDGIETISGLGWRLTDHATGRE